MKVTPETFPSLWLLLCAVHAIKALKGNIRILRRSQGLLPSVKSQRSEWVPEDRQSVRYWVHVAREWRGRWVESMEVHS